MKHWRTLLPLLVSAGLIAWLLWKISLPELLWAAEQLNWRLLAAITAAMVLALYLWDGLCLKTVYTTDHSPVTYGLMLRVRGIAYLVGAINHELGDALVAWNVSRVQDSPFLATLSRGVLLMVHDGVVLSSVGLLGASLSKDPYAVRVQVLCGCLLGGLLAAGVVLALLPRGLRLRFQATQPGAWLGSWSWGRSCRLVLLRLGYFAILGVYAAAGLRICGFPLTLADLLSTIPVVLLTVTVPSVSGLGPRETALELLLHPHGAAQAAALLAMGLFWSTGLIVGRLIIGLAHLWLVRSVVWPSPKPVSPEH